MKKAIFMLFLATTLFNCVKKDTTNATEDIAQATLIGRWSLVGFENNIVYEFTENKRFTIYGEEGKFGDIKKAIEDGLKGNDWKYEGDIVSIDLNFGNFLKLQPQFICNNNVINWLNTDGEIHSVIFREGFDYSSCSQ